MATETRDRRDPLERMRRTNRVVRGYLELARGQKGAGADDTAMRMAAIRELQRLTDDDEWVDAMYDADMREQSERERMGYDDTH